MISEATFALDCEARMDRDRSLVDTMEFASLSVLDGLKQYVDGKFSQLSPDDYGSPYYALLAKVDNIIEINADGEVKLYKGMTSEEELVLEIALESTQQAIDCSGCNLVGVCAVSSVFSQASGQLAERRAMQPLAETIQGTPTWLRSAWLSQSGKSMKRESRHAIMDGSILGTPVTAADVNSLIYLPNLEQVNTSISRPSTTFKALSDIDGVRVEEYVDSVSFKTPNHIVTINDARHAISANNAQNPNQNDVDAMLIKLLERASATIAVDKSGKSMVPALTRGQQRTGYVQIADYDGIGHLFEFRMFGEGAKSRLYGIVLYDQAESHVEFTIIGATSGNNSTSQDQFFAAIGINPT